MSRNRNNNGRKEDTEGEFEYNNYFAARMRPGSRIRLPVPKDEELYVARTETLEITPSLKKEIVDKYYNLYMSKRTIQVAPEDSKDELFGIFVEVITPAINQHEAGKMSDSDFARYLSDEFVRLINNSVKKCLRFVNDPAILGNTYFNQEEIDKNRKFNTTWRSFADLDK